jgi:hypothetical protein
MAHALQSRFSDTFVKHQDSMMASITHRLEVAKASNDRRLIELLERERQQIESSYTVPKTSIEALSAGFRSITASLRHWFAHRSELQVSQFVNGSDQWWYAFDPQSGNFVYADSEAELRLWIKDHYQGR